MNAPVVTIQIGKPVGSLLSFVSAAKSIQRGRSRYWFRGQHTPSRWRLRPALYRKNLDVVDALDDEDHLRDEFRRLVHRLTPERGYWGQYFLMQHFGVPTRLLDWSQNPLVALYFAVEERARDHKVMNDAVVFALDPIKLNRAVFKDAFAPKGRPAGILTPDFEASGAWLREALFRDEIQINHPVAILPPYLDDRVVAQGSRFVLFGRDPDGLVKVTGAIGSSLIAIPIKSKSTPRIRAELRDCGISHFTLYPDLVGLGRQLNLYWQDGSLLDLT
jgi:hypothetical protein